MGKQDYELLALVILAVSLFLSVSIYPKVPLSGEWGMYLRQQLTHTLGWLAYLSPLPLLFISLSLFLRRPVLNALKHTLLATLLGLSTLPIVARFDRHLAGWTGRVIHDWLSGQLGPAGLVAALLLFLAILDVWFGKYPFYGTTVFIKYGLRAGANLAKAAWSAVKTGRKHSQVRRQARKMLAEVNDLLQRYPDHTALVALREDLTRLSRRGTVGDEEQLRIFTELLGDFHKQRAAELLRRLEGEPPELLGEIESVARALANPLETRGPLFKELEDRRRALLLELASLKKQYLLLQSKVSKDIEVLSRNPARLNDVSLSLTKRSKGWRELEESLEEVSNRAEAWEKWLRWAESTPEEYHPAALQILSSAGLTASPPRLQDPQTDKTVETAVTGRTAPPPAPPEAAVDPPVASERDNGGGAPQGLSLPPIKLLDTPSKRRKNDTLELERIAADRAETINETLSHFGLQARVVAWARGPSVTRYEVEPAPGEKISRIAGLADDIARALAVGSVRVEAPIPGKHVIGLEVPNAERELVRFSEAVKHPAYGRSKDRLPLILGKSIDGEMWVRDLAGMPHLLIAGSTGSGKSVCVNTLVMSLLYRYLPGELRFLMIDPKMVELTPYDGIPHLVRGVVTNPADASGVLLGAVAHMERRYKMMSQVGARNLEQFNAKMREAGEPELPLLVIVIDELADLMITSPKEVEQAILRLAQMARATGMHLILATQRPSVDILTSLIKVNIPARIAFAVSSSHDSRTILDSTGAERLIGQGDMLFHQPGLAKPVRLQGPFLSDKEIRRITAYLREQDFADEFGEAYGGDFDGPLALGVNTNSVQGELPLDFSDPYLKRAAQIVVEEGQASVSRLQRRLSVGHARAGKLMDLMEAMGIVGPHQGSKPRDVLIAPEQLEDFFG